MNSKCVVLCLHDDWWFVSKAIEATKPFGPVLAFISRTSWNATAGDWQKVKDEAEKAGAEVILGDWSNETEHRREAYKTVRERGFQYALIPDGDEIIEPQLLTTLTKLAETQVAERVHVYMDTYWKSARYVIRPREQLAPAILINLNKVEHAYIRDFQGGRSITLGPEHGVIHHLSYAGPDERIQRKISTWSHKHELVDDWYRNVWLGWDSDKLMRDIHPTHPQAYGMAERIEIPEILDGIWDERAVATTHPQKPNNWPTLSIVIPLHGGKSDIQMCLDSLEASQDLIHELIVVDDASPDDAPSAAEREGVILLNNEQNEGFAKTCNKGFETSTGDVILFLNSDTVVPRSGLIKLIEGLLESGSIGAAGPMSNNVGYHQRISPTYSSLETLDNFAADLAGVETESRDVEILVGFALAVRRSVLSEVGAFDERFPVGMFEDTDLCYRIVRAGYRLRMVTNAYIHHWGSRTLQRVVPDMESLLHQNGAIYRKKWHSDLECGYASHLPGFNLNDGITRFDPSRKPEKVEQQLKVLKQRANISLCMIVKNEERVLDQCLESAKPFFNEIIIVDTGSTDRTKEIAKSHGVNLIESTWPDSFAEARNESLSHATGDWIFWLDADDVLPLQSGEAILHAAINATQDITGFVVPVQFVEEGPGAGTKVDHVKLIRNFSGISFEGRIHEQVLTSIRQYGGEIVRLNAVVLHAGYDTSPEGQARKRQRDWHLLNLDLQDRPEHPFVWFNIGMTHHFSGQHQEAVSALKNSIEFAGAQDSHLRKAYSLMGVSYREMGLLDESEQAFREGLERVGADPELIFQLAMTATAKGNLLEAKSLYEEVPSDTNGHFSSIDIGILTFKRLHNLAGIKMAMGDYIGARQDWISAFQANPRSSISLLALSDAALEFGDYKTARTCLDDLSRIEGLTIDWAERRAKLADAIQEPGGAMGMLDYFVNTQPHAVGPRLLLARNLLATGQTANAVPHLHKLEHQGVAEAAFLLGVHALQCNDIAGAIRFTERSVALNPSHAQSQDQLANLKKAMDVDTPCVLGEEERNFLLTGPKTGTLGKATKRHSVVIVTYNSQGWITKCLDSVIPTLGNHDEVIVVDNASQDETIKCVPKNSKVKVIANKENIGYAPAANVGISASKGEFITLLNPDARVSPGWLEGLSSRLTDGIAAVGPVSDNVGGAQFIGHYLEPGHPTEKLSAEMKRRFSSQQLETKLIMGMCVMVPRKVFDETGLLDEGLFLGADDLEHSWRLRELGYKLSIGLDVFVHHAGQKSFDTRDRSEVSELVAKSDAHLMRKLATYYGDKLPTSHQLWDCDIFDSALARKLL
ncbi:MAG TPA: glycosyltransferase [Fimbriimonas sp.]|nr:glycosyltransferase [Fimbriimonas sp.]